MAAASHSGSCRGIDAADDGLSVAAVGGAVSPLGVLSTVSQNYRQYG